MARYEVRIFNLEEMLPENRMTYSPCDGRDDAMQKYAEMLDSYADDLHVVSLCEVSYYAWGENVKTLASSDNADPHHIVWEEDWI